jgi:drug/metabolite transporter (DMT)-like permease
LLFSLMAVFWGIPYLLIRVAVRQLDPGVLVFARTAPAFALLLPLVLLRSDVGKLVRNLSWITAFGVIEFGIPWYFMASAERHITSSLTSLLICTVPLLSVLVHRLIGHHEKAPLRRYIGLGIGILGVALLVGLDVRSGSLKWIGVMLLVVVGYTFGPIILATKLSSVPGYVVVTGATGTVVLAWLPWSISRWPLHISSETWWSIITLSVVCTAAAFLTFFELVREIGASRSVVVTYLNTAIAVLLGVVGLHEPLTVGIAIGFPLVLIGSYFATSSARTTRLREAT